MATKVLKQGDIYRHVVCGEFHEVVVSKDKSLLEIRHVKRTFSKRMGGNVPARIWPTLEAWMNDIDPPAPLIQSRLTLCFADAAHTPIVELKGKWLEGAREQLKELHDKEVASGVVDCVE